MTLSRVSPGPALRLLWRHRGRALALSAGLTLVALATVLALASARAHLEAPAPSALLLDRHGRFLGEVGGSDERGFGYWPVEVIPERVAAAMVAIEDRRFWSHGGVDPKAVLRAAWQNLSSRRRVSGASTLAMQVARMQRPGPRTYLRKAVEAATAALLIRRNGREAVLAHYLRLVPYGNQVYGIAYAARRYLDKPVDDLSWAEVAFLAAIPQSPARMNPFDRAGRQRAVERGRRILAELARQGVIGPIEHEQALYELTSLQVPPRERRPDSAIHALLRLEARLGFEPPVGGTRTVTTSLEAELQEEVAWLTLEAAARWESSGAGNAAAVVVDRSSREVLAWVGSTDYFDERHAGAIDYTAVPRSPGSTLKPFVFAAALDRGHIGPATVLDDLHRGAGGIGNADERFLGPMLPRDALANSRNVPAADLLAAVGLENGWAFLGDLGLHDGTGSPRRYGLGLAIGALPVTLEQLVGAYLALADDGLLGDLVWYRGQPVTRPRRVMSEDTARLITLFLSDPMARLPTFPRMGSLEYPFPVAVKTGTSSGYHDAWCVAWSERYLVGAWIGHPDHRPMHRVSGYRSAAALVRSILLHLHPDRADGLRDVGFPPPRSSTPVRLCALTGDLATPACDRVHLEHLGPGDAPTRECGAHLSLAVDRRNGLLATSLTPPEQLELRPFVDLGPRYAAWQESAGLPRPPAAFSPIGGRPTAGTRWALGAIGGPQPWAGPVQRVSIVTPEAGLSVLRDPETPATAATLALQAVVEPPAEQVVWYVDGRPFQTTGYPYTARWPLQPGSHTFQARVAFTDVRSSQVTIRVQ